jgi:hypothetical protein
MMRDRDYQCNILTDDEREVVWKTGKVDSPPALLTKSPEQWMLNYG